jgi:lipoprotein Spr
MTKHVLFLSTLMLGFAFGPLQAQKTKQAATAAKSDVKFLDNITVELPASQNNTADPKAVFSQPFFTSKKAVTSQAPGVSQIENAGSIQLKFALLLDVEVEQAVSLGLFKVLDEWLGTRYRLGGTSKDGIDCSALMQTLFTSFYGVTLPRTAREQYQFSSRISRGELQEGDLVFFNTIGGVSHVGMYLQNNKFIHASSGGVTISDLYEDYWLKHFIGAGRVETNQQATALSLKP